MCGAIQCSRLFWSGVSMASVTKVGALPLVHCRQGSRVRGGVALSLSVVVVRNPEQRTFSLLPNIARLDLGPKPAFSTQVLDPANVHRCDDCWMGLSMQCKFVKSFSFRVVCIEKISLATIARSSCKLEEHRCNLRRSLTDDQNNIYARMRNHVDVEYAMCAMIFAWNLWRISRKSSCPNRSIPIIPEYRQI